MFSLISLYFAYRRDVVAAERYMAGLSEQSKPAPAEPRGAQESESGSGKLPLAA